MKKRTWFRRKSLNKSFGRKFFGFWENVFSKLTGKELTIWISIWLILMSVLMLFANNLQVSRVEPQSQTQWIEIHWAADTTSEIIGETIPWIGG